MLPMQSFSPSLGLAGEFRLRVLDGDLLPGGRTAASILAETLRRQGFHAAATGLEVEARRREGLRPADRDPQADVLLVLDEALLERNGALSGLNPEGMLVIATPRRPGEVRRQLRRYTGTVATVDAEALAEEYGSEPAIALLGAAARVAGFVDPEVLGTVTWVAYDRLWPYAAISAVRTLDAGWERVNY